MTSKKKILITGGTGFAGSHLVELLLNQSELDIHVTAYNGQPSDVRELLKPENIHQLNLTDEEATNELISKLKPDQIYHLAALSAVGSSFKNANKIITNNTLLQLNLLEAVRNIVPEARVLAIGSAQEYDFLKSAEGKVSEDHPLGPANPYAVSKVSQDLLALSYHYSYKLDIVRVRPFNHIGERQTPLFAVPNFAKQIAEAEKSGEAVMKVGNLEAIRDFTDVKDIVKAYSLLMEEGQAGEVYNVGSGQGFSMQWILDELISLSSVEIEVKQDPDKLRPLDVKEIIADNGRIKQLGWQPKIKISDTLRRVLDYWREQV